MKLIRSLALATVLFTASPSYAEFKVDYNQMNRWFSHMPITYQNAAHLDGKGRRHVTCLAMNIYHEARGSILQEKLAVAHVTINRTKHGSYDSDICNTIFQYSYHNGRKRPQFSWTVKSARYARELDAWLDSQKLAYQVYRGRTQDPTRGATHFHSRRIQPAWAKQGHQVAVIGHSKFMAMHSRHHAKVKRV